jgi:nicotinamide-nucleotide amidase
LADLVKNLETGLEAAATKLIGDLRVKKLTVSFAESCTGGLLSATITAIPDVSDLFLGSIVSYAYQAKVDLLGVSWDTLKAEGAVSQKVVEQMALGARMRLKSDWSMAITGIAGPSGGTADKPVGTVWFAASGLNLDCSKKMNFSGDRTQIQRQSAEFAIEFLRECISKS